MAQEYDFDFCKTTMSAMIMNYPPPTVVNLLERPDKVPDWEQEKLRGVLAYLQDSKIIKDNDLVMLVDGKNTWFQLPSEIMVKQYTHIIDDANRRMQRMYGGIFTQTIIFGARKDCDGDDEACRHVPASILPENMYHAGQSVADKPALSPAKYLNANMVMGPVKDLEVLFQAVAKVLEGKTQFATAQSVLTGLYSEQMLAREMLKMEKRPLILKIYDRFITKLTGFTQQADSRSFARQSDRQYEFSMGLDYTHALFQPLTDCMEDELRTIPPRLSPYDDTQNTSAPAVLPPAFINATNPFWRPDISTADPSPNDKPAYIDKLEYRYALDKLPRRDTLWTNVSLIQNAYTGAVPATFHVTNRHHTQNDPNPSSSRDTVISGRSLQAADITFSSLWYAPHARALLRRYFRTPQSPLGYHAAAVGGDLFWDQRGGHGGVWTAEAALWLPWGEVDGVCGTWEVMKDIFGDGKGVWFHEEEDGGGKATREKEEEEYKKELEEDKKADELWREKIEQERKEAEEKKMNEAKDREKKKKKKQEEHKQNVGDKEEEDIEEKERLDGGGHLEEAAS